MLHATLSPHPIEARIQGLGRWALVTGASSGIGLELAKMAASRGWNLVAVARRSDRLQEACLTLPAGGRILPLPLDLADPQAPQTLARFLEEQNIAVGFLIQAAGFTAHGELDSLPAETAASLIQVNAAAPMLLLRMLAGPMRRDGAGLVLNVASTAAFSPGPLQALYYASKALLLHGSEAAAWELAPSGVRVCCLCPGATRTAFFDRAGMTVPPAVQNRMMDPGPVARAGYAGLLAGRRVVVPGLFNRARVQAVRLLPRRWALALTHKALLGARAGGTPS